MKRLLIVLSILTLGLLAYNPVVFAQQKEGYGNETPENTTNQGGQAETDGDAVRDRAYDKISAKEKRALQYDHLREADIFWEKRVWRVIDTRQKMNLSFVYPEQPFIDVLLDIIKKHPEEARIYMDDKFEEQLSEGDVGKQLGSVDTIFVIDPITYQETQKIVRNDFNWMSVNKFRVKEDWIFDEETSTMVTRIMAIAPIMDVVDDNDNYRGQKAMFYAYYPDFRKFLVNYEVKNEDNEAQNLTWEDIFEMRYFGSYIMKESNIQDRRISEYAEGRQALFESERIKDEIFMKEHNLWSY